MMVVNLNKMNWKFHHEAIVSNHFVIYLITHTDTHIVASQAYIIIITLLFENQVKKKFKLKKIISFFSLNSFSNGHEIHLMMIDRKSSYNS